MDNKKILNLYFIGVLFFCGPTLLLYLNYLYYSIGKTIVVNRNEQKIYIKTWNKNYYLNITDIRKEVKICSYPVGENRIQWMPTDPFFYIKIIMKNDQSVVITSLMTDIHFEINDLKIEIEKRLIPYI